MARRRRFKFSPPKINFSKRGKFVFTTLILVFGLLSTQLVHSDLKFLMVGILAFFTYLLSAWVLREDLNGIEWFTLLVLPTMYTAAFGFSYFLLPTRWITRIPIAALYGVGFYALLLTENIYNVAAERTIGLLRAAHAVGFLLTLVCVFLLSETLLSFHLQFWANALIVFLLITPLFFQSLWTIKLEQSSLSNILKYAIFLSLILAQVAFVLSFWPLVTILESLFLTALAYTLLGIGQQYFAGRLFQRAVLEFSSVGLAVFILLLLTTRWGG